MPPEYPCFAFFPALPLDGQLELGDWIVGPRPTGIPWLSPKFEALATRLVKAFAPHFKNGAHVWHRSRGFDGSCPSETDIACLASAVRFAALDGNDAYWDQKTDPAHSFVTTENAVLIVQPIDEASELITHIRQGLLVRMLHGGLTIGDSPLPFPTETPSISRPVRLSGKLARATFDFLSRPTDPGVQVAIEWHSLSMFNTEAVTWGQRIVAIKTGFEALAGKSELSWEHAAEIRRLFEDVTRPHAHLLPWSGLLWTPSEKIFSRSYTTKYGKPKTSQRTELEDWFMTLADARNDIIHKGVGSKTEYRPTERPRSRYAGPLFHVGERVLREAIKAKFGADVLLCSALKGARMRVQMPRAAAPPPQHATAPNRDVPTLLGILGCQQANELLIDCQYRPVLLSEDDPPPERIGETVWLACSGSRSVATGRYPREIGVTEAEAAMLLQAGAERELDDFWMPCD